tara:strand:- start:338 stop:541 length:204 start_codon:yes stop_codon:yes gene_type:complete
MKNINHKIKSLSIELEKSTKLNELNSVIKKFKKDTDIRYEVVVSLDIVSGSLILTRTRKPYLKLVKK